VGEKGGENNVGERKGEGALMETRYWRDWERVGFGLVVFFLNFQNDTTTQLLPKCMLTT
jgi:hypothetical protein